MNITLYDFANHLGLPEPGRWPMLMVRALAILVLLGLGVFPFVNAWRWHSGRFQTVAASLASFLLGLPLLGLLAWLAFGPERNEWNGNRLDYTRPALWAMLLGAIVAGNWLALWLYRRRWEPYVSRLRTPTNDGLAYRHCPRCGYPRAGNPGAMTCPECGALLPRRVAGPAPSPPAGAGDSGAA